MQILSLDLGKNKTVGCDYERESRSDRGSGLRFCDSHWSQIILPVPRESQKPGRNNFLDDLSNSVRPFDYSEGRATGPPEDRYRRMKKSLRSIWLLFTTPTTTTGRPEAMSKIQIEDPLFSSILFGV